MTTCQVLTACQCTECRPQTPVESKYHYRESWRHEQIFTGSHLCLTRKGEHLKSADHISNVVAFLTYRGLNRAEAIVREYGILAADLVAAEINQAEMEGTEWAEGLRVKGAWIHAHIRARAGKRVAPKSEPIDHLDEYRELKGALPWSN